MKEYTILDIETVSLTDKRLLEIGAVKVLDDFTVIEELEVRTTVPWPIGHISGKEVPIGKYSPTEARRILMNFIGNSIVVGFNLDFECAALGVMISKKVDMMKMFKMKFPGQPYNLKAVASFYGVVPVEEHRGLGDCLTLLQILKRNSGLS